LTEAGSEA